MFDHTPELAGNLTANDFPSESVQLYLGENGPEGFCLFDSAFWTAEGSQKAGRYFVVYTEHLGYFVFSEHSVSLIRGMQRILDKLFRREAAGFGPPPPPVDLSSFRTST